MAGLFCASSRPSPEGEGQLFIYAAVRCDIGCLPCVKFQISNLKFPSSKFKRNFEI
jgi:hypothetical protein